MTPVYLTYILNFALTFFHNQEEAHVILRSLKNY